MDYQSIYDRLIEKHRHNKRIKGKTNDHHIIPQCFAKVDNINDIDGRWNRVHLPHREHFIAHLLLARIWRGHKTKGPMMGKAFRAMSGQGVYNSKDYSWLKLDCSHTEETKEKIGKGNTGKKRSDECRLLMSEKAKSRCMDPNYIEHLRNNGRKTASLNLPHPRGMLGKKHHSSSIEKMKKPKSDEWKKAISDASQNRERKTCPHCGKNVAVNIYARCHGEKCKLLSPPSRRR